MPYCIIFNCPTGHLVPLIHLPPRVSQSQVAFGLGAVTHLPAIRWFSIYATINVACVMAMQLTFFLAAFVLNERRIAARRVDLACCCVVAVPELETGDKVCSLPVRPRAFCGPASCVFLGAADMQQVSMCVLRSIRPHTKHLSFLQT